MTVADYSIPKFWQSKKIEESCSKISLNGIKIKQKDYLLEGKYPVVDQGQELVGGYYNDDNLLVSNDPPYIIFGDHTKVKKFINFKFIAGADGVKILKPYPFLEPKFFYYCLHVVKIPDKGYARHFQFLEKENVPIPPLPEQRAIVAKIELLSELDNGIANLKTALAQRKIYRQAVLKYAFEGKLTNKYVKEGKLPEGWMKLNVGQICDCIVPNRDKPKSFSGDIPWITTPDLSENSIIINYSKIKLGLTKDEILKYRAKVIPVGSVLMTCVGKFGIAAIVEKESVINQQLHAFLPNDKIIPKYLAYALKTQQGYMNDISTAITISYLNKSNCNSVPINLPLKVNEQKQIIMEIESRLSVCDKLEADIQENLSKAEALRKSILKKAFDGRLLSKQELTSCRKEPDWEPAEKLLERIKKEINKK